MHVMSVEELKRERACTGKNSGELREREREREGERATYSLVV